MSPSPPDPAPAMRPPWQVALYAGAVTLALGIGVAVLAGIATGAIHRHPRWAAEHFVPAWLPFVVIIAVAAYAIQRSRIKNR
ncbi:MAG TPA: hypothetical protein VH165_02610 [Kofleriaceae bacterium]|nr:hypothetical protein [Kofleriaceae bacterium]